MPKGVYVRSEKQLEKLRELGRDGRGKPKNFTEEYKKICANRFREQAALRKGKKREAFSEEWKKKMSNSRIGKEPWNKGKTGIYSKETIEKIRIGRLKQTFSEKTRRKLSETNKKKVELGIHHLWKGGIYPVNLAIRKSLEYKLWREAVFKRDNFSCVFCGSNKSGNLEADHIMKFSLYPELRFVIENGRTLCKECHRKTDTYGKQNPNHKRKGL